MEGWFRVQEHRIMFWRWWEVDCHCFPECRKWMEKGWIWHISCVMSLKEHSRLFHRRLYKNENGFWTKFVYFDISTMNRRISLFERMTVNLRCHEITPKMGFFIIMFTFTLIVQCVTGWNPSNPEIVLDIGQKPEKEEKV